MEQVAPIRQIDQQIIDGLYIEAVVLADEARAYFDFRPGQIAPSSIAMSGSTSLLSL